MKQTPFLYSPQLIFLYSPTTPYEGKRGLVADLDARSKVAETYLEEIIKAFLSANRSRKGKTPVYELKT